MRNYILSENISSINNKNEFKLIVMGNNVKWQRSQLIRNSAIRNTDCIVVIPVYKDSLKVEEKISLFQCIKYLGDTYEICLVHPKSVDIDYYTEISNNFRFDDLPCNNEYFINTATYSRLCEETEFYGSFSEFKYMLIYQLDGWVFEQNLQQFLSMDYDYIGSPWPAGAYGFNKMQVGNGGVSLRKISKFIELCSNLNMFDFESRYAKSEDIFFCKYVKSVKRHIDFKIASAADGLKFGWTTNPPFFYEENGNRLPMFAHGWNVGYDYENFYCKYIPLDEYKSNKDFDYVFYDGKIKNNNQSIKISAIDEFKSLSLTDKIDSYGMTADNEQKKSDNADIYDYGYSLNNNVNNTATAASSMASNVYDDYYTGKTENVDVSEKIQKSANSIQIKISENETSNITKNKSNITEISPKINKDNGILICIFNYKHDNNAKKWLHVLQEHFETVVLDSGNDHDENEFIQFPNIYYSGLWNEMKKLAEKKAYKYIGQICSDVEITDDNAQLLISKLYSLLLTDKIGIWQPAADKNSRKNWTVRVNNNYKYTFPSIIEGWMSFISYDVLKHINYIDTKINLFGYGIDIVTSVKALEMHKLLVIDNTVQVYNPDGTGYDNKLAYAQGNAYMKKILGKSIMDYVGKYTVVNDNNIDGYDTDITFIIPIRGRDDMRIHFEKNIKKVFKKYIYKILYINQNDTNLFRLGQLRNIGCRFINSKYIIIQDVDVIHLHPIDINKIYTQFNHPVRLYDKVSQITIGNRENYNITKTEKRNGTGACILMSADDWYEYNGFSNLFRGWGSEDDTFREFSEIKTYVQDIGHITHPKNNKTNIQATKKNSDIYFNYILKNKIDHFLDGWRQEIFVIDNITSNNNIFNIFVSHIDVCNNYQYKSLYNEYNNLDVTKKVIYTCISGNYDQLKKIEKKNDNWDYICFTDQPITSDVWEIRPIPAELNKYSQIKKQRLLKILSYKYLPEYDNVIWIDANILILNTDELDNFLSSIKNGKPIAFKLHPHRKCIYSEIAACVKYHKETPEMAEILRKKYIKENVPENIGMYETNIFYRDNNDKKVITLMDAWAKELINLSHRDQLSLNYCIWKLQCNDIISEFTPDEAAKYFTWQKHKKY